MRTKRELKESKNNYKPHRLIIQRLNLIISYGILKASYGDRSSVAERQLVELDVAGSNPVGHPKQEIPSGIFLFGDVSD